MIARRGRNYLDCRLSNCSQLVPSIDVNLGRNHCLVDWSIWIPAFSGYKWTYASWRPKGSLPLFCFPQQVEGVYACGEDVFFEKTKQKGREGGGGKWRVFVQFAKADQATKMEMRRNTSASEMSCSDVDDNEGKNTK